MAPLLPNRAPFLSFRLVLGAPRVLPVLPGCSLSAPRIRSFSTSLCDDGALVRRAAESCGVKRFKSIPVQRSPVGGRHLQRMNGFLLSVAPKAGPCHRTIGRGTYLLHNSGVMEWRRPVFQRQGLSKGWICSIVRTVGQILFSQLRDGIIYSSRTRPQIIYSLSSREAACSALLVRATWWDLGSYR